VNNWAVALVVYVTVAFLSFLPVLMLLIKRVKPHPGGPSFDDSPWFSDVAKNILNHNFERLRGALGFWKTQSARYHAFYIYSVIWVTLATVSVPFIAQAISSDPWSRWFLSVVSAHAALLLALSRAFRVEGNYKAFRQGESEFYDLWRRLLDRPESFGRDEREQIQRYLENVEVIRRLVRTAETDNLPSIEEVAQHSSLQLPDKSPRPERSRDRGLEPHSQTLDMTTRKEGSSPAPAAETPVDKKPT
jgi:hypothetical protein